MGVLSNIPDLGRTRDEVRKRVFAKPEVGTWAQLFCVGRKSVLCSLGCCFGDSAPEGTSSIVPDCVSETNC